MLHPRISVAAAIGVCLVFTLGCRPQPIPERGGDAPTAETPQYGGLLHVPARPTFETKDPFKGAGGSSIGLKSRPTYEPIVAYKTGPNVNFRAAREVVPWLAERWEQTSPTEYIFTLRQGVKFHDGVEMTSADVVHTFKRAVDPKTQYVSGYSLSQVMKDVEALDKSRVRLTLTGPSPDLLFEIVADIVKIQPKHWADQRKSLEQESNGTGPFKLVTLDNQKGITFERNPNYWDTGRPFLDGIVVHRGLDDAAIVAALATGRMDAYNPGGIADLQQVDSLVPGIRYAEYLETYANAVFMRLDKPPFNDIRVRKALHLVLDRERLISLAYQGRGKPTPPGAQADLVWAIPANELGQMPGYRQPKAQDIAEAKRLLAEAGFPQGFKFEMKFRPTLSSSNAIAEPLASAWRNDLGIEVTLKPEETAVFELSRKNASYDVMLTTTSDIPFAGFLDHFYSKGPYAGYGINDPALDSLILASQTEGDHQKRVQMAREMQRIVLDKVYAIPTTERFGFAAWQPWLRDYLYNPGAQVIPLYTPAITWIDLTRAPEFRRGERLPF